MHIPVLLEEVLQGLDLQENDIVLDGTVGGGGHSEAICRKLGKKGTLIGIDADAKALEIVAERLKGAGCRVFLAENNFRDLDAVLEKFGIRFVTKILFDLGMSSRQLDVAGRGFSFLKDEPLLMTFMKDPSGETLTAREIVNEWSEETLVEILKGYGEERFARRIVQAIAAERLHAPIETTAALARIIEAAVPVWYQKGRLHPATKTFQALRIAVNDELETLKEGLTKGFDHLESRGRMAVISFHSLEDRIVKRFFKERAEEGSAVRITKRPITPTLSERSMNQRSRSAKLRILEKL